MALLEFEGFDGFPAALNALTVMSSKIDASGASKWSCGTSVTMNRNTALSASGTSLSTNGGVVQTYSIGSNKTTLITGLRWNATGLTTNSIIFAFLDGASTQVGVAINASHQLFVFRGTTATVLATGPTVLLANATYLIEFKATMHGTTGAYEVRLGGSAEIGPTTGANTISTANAFANAATINWIGPNTTLIDDYYLCDDTGAVANTFLGNVRVETTYPNGPDALAWSPLNTESSVNATNLANCQLVANRPQFYAIVPSVGGTLTQVRCRLSASMTGNMNCALYASSGSLPTGTPIATATQITNPVGNATVALAPDIFFTFGSPFTMIAGTTYWVCFFSDTTTNFFGTNAGSANGQWMAGGSTYGSGFPTAASLTQITGSSSFMCFWSGGILGNFMSVLQVSETAVDSDTTYNSSASTGQVDTFIHAALSGTPATVYGVQVQSWARKDDVSAQSFRNKLKSGATTANGATHVNDLVNGIYQRFVDQYTTDPNTGATWTGTNAGNTKTGYEHV